VRRTIGDEVFACTFASARKCAQTWRVLGKYLEPLQNERTIRGSGARDAAIVIGTVHDKISLATNGPTARLEGEVPQLTLPHREQTDVCPSPGLDKPGGPHLPSGVRLWYDRAEEHHARRRGAVGGAHGEGCDPVQLTAELFWRLFEATGSIRAYLLYKRLSVQ